MKFTIEVDESSCNFMHVDMQKLAVHDGVCAYLGCLGDTAIERGGSSFKDWCARDGSPPIGCRETLIHRRLAAEDARELFLLRVKDVHTKCRVAHESVVDRC